jgi:beta-lactamase class A
LPDRAVVGEGFSAGVLGSWLVAADQSHRGRQLAWLLELINGDLDATDAAEHFVIAFLDKHPSGLAQLIAGWRSQGPYTLDAYVPVAHRAWLELRDRDGRPMTLNCVLDSSGLLRLANLAPAPVVPPVTSWSDLDAALDLPGVRHSLLAASVDQPSGELRPLYERNADRPMALASVFKYVVLHTVIRAVRDGTVCWQQLLTLTPEVRSLPTGDLQDEPDGTTITVSAAAYKMIAISDNTATDLLIGLVGRAAVEQAAAEFFEHQPRPFLTTRELFELGWGASGLRTRWRAAAEAGRYALLDQLAGTPLTARIQDMTGVVHLDGLDWYASAREVAHLLAGLWRDAQQDEAVRQLLVANTGIPIDESQWASVVFKAGVNPGVLAFCWLAEDHDGNCRLLIMQQSAADPALVRDTRIPLALGQRALNILLPPDDSHSR